MAWDGLTGYCDDNELNGLTITECYNKANIVVVDPGNNLTVSYVGGITGGVNHEKSKISYCYNTGNISSTGCWTGGISSGLTRGATLENCYNKGNITVEGNKNQPVYEGGIIGNTYCDNNYGKKICKMSNCYNLGEVNCKKSGNYRHIAGVMGYIQTGYTQMENCYNQGRVSSVTGANVGGILGLVSNYEQIIINHCATTKLTAIGKNEATSNNAVITNVLGEQTTIPTILSVINSGEEEIFVEDITNINEGDPVLKWQVENKK